MKTLVKYFPFMTSAQPNPRLVVTFREVEFHLCEFRRIGMAKVVLNVVLNVVFSRQVDLDFGKPIFIRALCPECSAREELESLSNCTDRLGPHKDDFEVQGCTRT